MIEIRNLTKIYGNVRAVNDISAIIPPGKVTGFVGPNGAGKSTTMRIALGLDRPTSGTATINGQKFADSPAPISTAGALLDARGIHPGRKARAHLRAIADTHGVSGARVEQVLDIVGLRSVADRRVGTFSLGMGQRLGIAAAMLGDPGVYLLDEPVNGLDPAGVRWIRHLTRSWAAEGRTVLVSSHLMSELAQIADDVLVIGRGSILAHAPTADVMAGREQVRTRVVASDMDALLAALKHPSVNDGVIEGLDARTIGDAAARAGIALYELTPLHSSLEDAFFSLTDDSVQFSTPEVSK
ncbi:ABC-2 type transport system ATP-binding protein [Bowdeniella nasicola]|uniref:ABC-2 type transport system ATP-binding protein n=1 Tax=Bowdeniella nasicola TaxID=208480 RepID=A0A1H4A5S3_9ACTO|nr:ATP-binding cassette domain-containing protein [Bowdeniella nasicola]SEA31306.1 ABC-2 type transport system ATP-binding protein [Bowdeniella nasicola]